MTCEDVQAVLPLWAAGAAEAGMVTAVTEHVAACERCAVEMTACRSTVAQTQFGLGQWASAGGMPSELVCRLESSIHHEARAQASRAARVRTLLTAMAAAAAAFALFMVIPSAAAPGSQPLVGFLAALFQGPRAPVDPAAAAPEVVPVGASSTAAGVRFTVDTVAFGEESTVVRYRLQGLPARLEATLPGSEIVAAELLTAAGPVALRGITVALNRPGVDAEVTAIYAPVPRGTGLRLRISQLPLGSQGEQIRGPWQVDLPAS